MSSADHASATSSADAIVDRPASTTPPASSQVVEHVAPAHPARRKWPWIVGLIALVIAAIVGIPWVHSALTTVSTDDAYVNGHVTFVAPRVSGQVQRVLVDDNTVVRKGDVLVELDPEPFQVQVDIARA